MALNLAWASWPDFFAMGGYGLYVWGSFGACAAVVAGELLAIRARRAALRHAVNPEPGSEQSIGQSQP